MVDSLPSFVLLVSVVSALAAVAGVWLGAVPGIARKLVPVSGAMLIVLSLVWVLPDLAEAFGWHTAPMLMFGSFGLVWLVDRNIYPICPSCAHSHDHDTCTTRLHGFAGPLAAAAALHGVFDGYALSAGLGGLWVGVALHKLPEGLALGALLRAASRNKSQALLTAGLLQAALPLGAAFEAHTRSPMTAQFMPALLALGGGTFLYLGFHAVHGEWKRRLAAQA